MRIKLAAAVAAAALLAGCGGRTANPVSVVQPTDAVANCDILAAEIHANNRRMQSLADQKSNTTGKNVALAVVGVVLFWPALFAMDLSDSERVEIQALQDRNAHLATLGATKRCNLGPIPTSPEAAREQDMARKASEGLKSGTTPKCKDVGGYEEYKKRTGQVCDL